MNCVYSDLRVRSGGGALFAAFPEVYATVFSGFYIAFFVFLAALIFRAVSLEFRGKIHSPWWQRCLHSYLPPAAVEVIEPLRRELSEGLDEAGFPLRLSAGISTYPSMTTVEPSGSDTVT